jgi:predicted metal-dependent phosphoesterase TrpH
MKLDLHIHSTFSRDGTSSPEQIVERCKELGLDGFAITDHNAIQGSLQAVDLAKRKGMLAIRGVEVSTVDGHVLAYGVSELVPKGLSIRETIDKVHAAGGVAVAPHPLRFPSGIGLDSAAEQGFDAIEVLNGGNSRRSNGQALKLARKLGRSVTAGSDSHKIDEIGKAYIEIDGASSEEDVLLAIRRGLTRAGGRSRTRAEGTVYSIETLIEWLRGSFKRL